jgi:hypothetical protein
MVLANPTYIAITNVCIQLQNDGSTIAPSARNYMLCIFYGGLAYVQALPCKYCKCRTRYYTHSVRSKCTYNLQLKLLGLHYFIRPHRLFHS